MHAELIHDSEDHGPENEHPDDEPPGTSATFEDIGHRVRSTVENRQEPMRCGRDQFRHSPHGPTYDDLEDEHIQHDTTRRQPKDSCDGNEDDEHTEDVVNVQNEHVRGASRGR